MIFSAHVQEFTRENHKMTSLSDATLLRVERLFLPSERAGVCKVLQDACGDSERLQFAVLKLSEGRWADLQRWAVDVRIDYRDVLMAAGFGYDVNAHWQWLPEARGK